MSRLSSDEMTKPERITFPLYIAVNAVFGGVFLTDPEGRLAAAPSLEVARDWLPLQVWGAMWATLAVLMVAAFLLGNRWLFTAALGVNVLAWLGWGIVVEAAVFYQPNVTYLAGALPWFVSAACLASLVGSVALLVNRPAS